MRLEQRKSPRLETRVGNKGLIAISKPPFLRVVMICYVRILNIVKTNINFKEKKQ